MSEKIAVLGLGYVGLPLLIGLARHFEGVIGFDIDPKRVAALNAAHDWTGEVTTQELKDMILAQFNVLVTFLLIMAALLGIVGALGLAGTMSINVVERTREIGVMRAVGAGNRDILQLVMVEGVMIGCLSWAMGLVLSVPVSKFMSDQVGVLFIQSPLTFRFSVSGALIWLVVILVASMLATWLPARNASRVSVRESLSYE